MVAHNHIQLCAEAQCSTVRGLITSTLPHVSSAVQSYNLMFSLGGALSICLDNSTLLSGLTTCVDQL